MSRAAPLPPSQRRAAIIAATKPLLEVHGRTVSTRQIAAAAGVAEGTIFRVFPTKQALIDAVIAEAFDLGSTCQAIAAVDPELDLEQRLVAVVDTLQRRLRRVFASFHSVAFTPPEPRDEFHTRQQRDNAVLNSAIADLLKADHERLRIDPESAANLVRTLTFSVTHPILSDQRHADPAEVVRILLHGIAASGHLGTPCDRGCRCARPNQEERPC